MNNRNISFKEIQGQEEFFQIFRGLCTIAENAFNEVEKEIEEITKKRDPSRYISDSFYKDISQLMSITIVIRGMRGDYSKFKDKYMNDTLFFIEENGVIYDQSYLYKMNDYFSYRLMDILHFIEKINPTYAEMYGLIYRLS